MIKIPNKLLAIVCCVIFSSTTKDTFALSYCDTAAENVTAVLTLNSRDGIFTSAASFSFQINNKLQKLQSGKISYVVTTEANKKVKSDSVAVNIEKESTKTFDFNIPGLDPGFYKINFMVNVSDYDDTTYKAFGIKPGDIRSQFAKPADFDSFWQSAKEELAKVDPQFKVTEMPDSSKDGRRVFLVEMKSLGNLTVRGWLTEPVTTNKRKKFAVLLGLPGYQVALKPMFGTDPDIAIFTLNIRGAGNSRDVINVRRENYILLDIENKNRYVLRGALMDCVRAVDFIYSRPELRHDNIIAAGGSLGGFLAVAASGIDKRINFCSAANPILCDVRNLVNEVNWPFIDIRKYVYTRPGLTMGKVLDNMDYFDGKNFATNLQIPTLVGLGLVDNIAPPNNVYALYNNIPSQKHMIVFKDLGHEIGNKFKVYEGRWMRDTFALF